MYLESALALHLIQLSRRLPIILYFNTVLGFSVFEGPNEDVPDEVALFQEESFTHLDLSLALNIVLSRKHAVTLDLEPHFEVKFDAATERVGPGPDDIHHQQFWLTMAFSFHPVLVSGHQGR